MSRGSENNDFTVLLVDGWNCFWRVHDSFIRVLCYLMWLFALPTVSYAKKKRTVHDQFALSRVGCVGTVFIGEMENKNKI